jgi:hypothetical protein
MDIVLLPGFSLDGSSWDKVVPSLEQAGHRTHPLTLPGVESTDADRSRITLRDHVNAACATSISQDSHQSRTPKPSASVRYRSVGP